MHAVLITVTIDPAKAEAAREGLMNEVIPQLKAATGFVAAYWLEPEDGKGFSMTLFETEAQARLMAPTVGSVSETGVTFESVEFRPVAASI